MAITMVAVIMLNITCVRAIIFLSLCSPDVLINATIQVLIADPRFAPIMIPTAIGNDINPLPNAVMVMTLVPVLVWRIIVMMSPISIYHRNPICI